MTMIDLLINVGIIFFLALLLAYLLWKEKRDNDAFGRSFGSMLKARRDAMEESFLNGDREKAEMMQQSARDIIGWTRDILR